MAEDLISRDPSHDTTPDSNGHIKGFDTYVRIMEEEEAVARAKVEAARAQAAADLEDLNKPGDDGRYPGEPLPQPQTWRDVVGDEAVAYEKPFRD